MNSFPFGSATTRASPSSTPRRKRKCQRVDNNQNNEREIQRSPGTCLPIQLFSQKFCDAEPRLLSLLKDCQQHLNPGKDGEIPCQAVYTFSKELGQLHQGAMNLYGYGKFVALCVGNAGISVLQGTGDEYGEHCVSLKTFIEEKGEPETVDLAKVHTFEWRAKVQFDRVPPGCLIKSVQLVFAQSDGRLTPAVTMKYFPEDGHCSYIVSATFRTVDELQIFRKPTCHVTMLLPVLFVLQESLRELRDLGYVCASNIPFDEYVGEDAVILTNGEFSIKVARQVLMSLSAECNAIFRKKAVGTVHTYEIALCREVVVAVLGAAISKTDAFPLDPCTASPMYLYGLMTLSTVWDILPLKLWSQMAFLECLGSVQFDLGSAQIAEAVLCIWDNYCMNKSYTAGKFILVAISIVLQCKDTEKFRRVMGALLGENPALQIAIEQVVGPGQPCLQIFVMDLHSTPVLLRVDPWSTIGQVKQMLVLHKKVPFSVDRLRLTYGPKPLDNERTLAEYGVQNESTLQLSLYSN